MNNSFSLLASLMGTFLSMFGKAEPSLPAVLWHMDEKGKISLIHKKMPSAANVDVGLLLKDADYALGVVKARDKEVFLETMRRVRERRPVAALFDADCPSDEPRRLALLGTPESTGTGYWGLLADCTALLRPERGSSPQRPADSFETPLLTVGFTDSRIRRANPAARDLLGLHEGREASFEEYWPLFSDEKEAIREALLFDGVWKGSFAIRGARDALTCEAAIRPLSRERLLEIDLRCVPFPQRQDSFKRLAALLEKAHDERVLLQAIFEHHAESEKMGGILLSHIFQEENRIVVSAVGPLFGEGLPPSEYAYAGSIADDIVREGLPFLIEEETVRSTRPVDWVIYVPRGISSYCAVPFFTDTRLDMVLVFCSARARAFGEGDIPACRETLHLLAEHIRRVADIG